MAPQLCRPGHAVHAPITLLGSMFVVWSVALLLVRETLRPNTEHVCLAFEPRLVQFRDHALVTGVRYGFEPS